MAEEKKMNETEKKTASESLGMQTLITAQSFQDMLGTAADDEKPLKVVGLQSSKRKDGAGYSYNLFFEQEFNGYDLQRGQCVGVKVSSVYLRNESKIPPDLKLGDYVKVYSVPRGNYVVVDEIRILNR